MHSCIYLRWLSKVLFVQCYNSRDSTSSGEQNGIACTDTCHADIDICVCMSIKIHVIIYSDDILSMLSFKMYHVIVEGKISSVFYFIFQTISSARDPFNTIFRGNEAFLVILCFGFYRWPVTVFEFHHQF